MARLTKYIYNVSGVDGGDMGRIRTRAMLCHIYHHALHNRWVQAHDLMLMSHLQEGIHLADIPTQVRITTCPPLPYNLIDSLIRCKLWREVKKSAENLGSHLGSNPNASQMLLALSQQTHNKEVKEVM